MVHTSVQCSTVMHLVGGLLQKLDCHWSDSCHGVDSLSSFLLHHSSASIFLSLQIGLLSCSGIMQLYFYTIEHQIRSEQWSTPSKCFLDAVWGA